MDGPEDTAAGPIARLIAACAQNRALTILSSTSAVVMPLRMTVSSSPRAVMSNVFHFPAVLTVWAGPVTLTMLPDLLSGLSCVSAMLTS